MDSFRHPKSKRLSRCYRVSYRSMDRTLTNVGPRTAPPRIPRLLPLLQPPVASSLLLCGVSPPASACRWLAAGEVVWRQAEVDAMQWDFVEQLKAKLQVEIR